MGLDIITCPEWHARQPKHPITVVTAVKEIIFHHTAGHHAEIERPADESLEEAIRYARDVQAYHMDNNGWTDSGHNFLVCRNGVVLQGRWLTVSAIESGHMVDSAHCPGHNHSVGIEHEHAGNEKPTDAQIEASAVLQAWIAYHFGRRQVLPVHPHKQYYSTSCPANLVTYIPKITKLAQTFLTKEAF